MFNRIAVMTIPPWTVVAGRIGMAALLLYAIMRFTGRRLPAAGRHWWPFVLIAAVGNALPFYLIAWGQQVVESALAGILMAVMPLATLLLAHVLVDGERLTSRRAAGFVVGFAGVIMLMGPAALTGIGGDVLRVLSQAAILGGALCYALQSVLTRLIIKGDVLVSATATMIVATLMVLPFALWLDRPWLLSVTPGAAASVLWLGLGPTALATILYFQLIRSAGPTFMSLVNYLSPCVALVLGLTLMGEHPQPAAYAGLVLILGGIAVTRWQARLPREG
jgi:drug/metabolite transporter (DMT)-like permease